MSDLADAVFGGQLLGHVIAGEELTASVITDAAMTAELASNLSTHHDLSSVEHEVLQAKVAQQTIADGGYSPSDCMIDIMPSNQADGLLS